MISLDNEFIKALENKLLTLPKWSDNNYTREERWMTADQIKSGIDFQHNFTAEEIEQGLWYRWQTDELKKIRPAKYPHESLLVSLWGHVERVSEVGKNDIEPFRTDDSEVLLPLKLPADAPIFFLSFSRTDLQKALEVRIAMAEMGVNTWLYINQINKGQHIAEVVRNGMKQSMGAIVLVTRISIGSPWIYTEVQTAVKSGLTVAVFFEANDKELMELFASWQPGAYLDKNNEKAKVLESAFLAEHTERHTGSYMDNMMHFYFSLSQYSLKVFFVKRPAVWTNPEDFISFKELTIKMLIKGKE